MSFTQSRPFRAGASKLPSRPFDHAAAAAAAPIVLLADCSEFQWNIADDTYLLWSHAIIIRAAYGTQHTDHAWYGGERRSCLHDAGIRFLGIYQYLVSGQSGADQAQAFLDIVGQIQNGEVFIADFEEGNHQMLTDWYNKMIALYGSWISPYLWTYTGLNFGKNNNAAGAQWVASYSQNEPAGAHKMWQFTDSFSIPGVGVADCSLFRGTMDQLAALGHQG